MNNHTSIPAIEDVFRIPRAGKIKLGEKVEYEIKKGPNAGQMGERPKELDYFKCPPEVQAVFKEKPKELKIELPSNEVSEIMPYAFKRYKSGAGLICKGDGTTAGSINKENGIDEIDCPGVECQHYKKGDCKLSACLFVILPHVDTFRAYQVDTNSWNSIVNIINCLRRVQAQYQRLTNLHHPVTLEPILRLVRQPQETHGSGRKETHYTMSIYADMPLGLLREIRDGLSNPNLLSAPTHRSPGQTAEDYKEDTQNGVDALYPDNPSPPKTVEVEVENTTDLQAVLDRIAECKSIPEHESVEKKYVKAYTWNTLQFTVISKALGENRLAILKALKNKGADKQEPKNEGGEEEKELSPVELKNKAYGLFTTNKMDTEKRKKACVAITKDKTKTTPNFMTRPQLRELITVLGG